MGEVIKFTKVSDAECVLKSALEDLTSFEATGVMVVMVNEDGGLFVTYNESLGADGAIVMCECVKTMNVMALLSDED